MFFELILIFAVFGIIGLLATLAAISVLFTSIGKNVSSIEADQEVPTVSSDQFLKNIVTLSGADSVNFDTGDCEIFTSNESYAEALLNDVKNAHASISIMTYVWDHDEETARFFDLLKEAVARGVKVRLIVDAHGSSISQNTIQALKEAGLEIEIFRPFKLGKMLKYYARTHRRAYLFDGKVGYFGGAAITKRWFKDSLPDDFVYIDTMYKVSGEPVEKIAASFGELWSTYSPTIAQNLFVDSIDRSGPVNAFSLSHSPRNDVHPLTTAFWYACAAARKEIFVVNPYFVPGHALKKILCEQAKAGVHVNLLVQGSGENSYVKYAARSYYDNLLEAGVKIFEHKKPHLHAKFLIIDGAFTICGSANFDIRSQRINHELIFGVRSESFAARHAEVRDEYLADAKEVTATDRTRLRPLNRLLEASSRLVSEQF